MSAEQKKGEKQLIEDYYDDLVRSFGQRFSEEDRERIRKAFEFANQAHAGVNKKSGEPYIMHPLAVAIIVSAEFGLGVTSILAAILHDVLEDTGSMLEDISNLFGSKVAKVVDGLAKLSDEITSQQDSKQATCFRKMLVTLSDDVRVILIKLADRLHNMRTLDSMPPPKQLKIAAETLYIFAPLAHRLGLYTIKTELEDLSLKHRQPETYNLIKFRLHNQKERRDYLVDEFIEPIKKQLTEEKIEFNISGRLKSIYSIWEKMQNKGVSFDEIYDLLAIRIVFKPNELVSEKRQCFDILSLITDIYKPKPDRIRDWITMPKANGYEALHVTVMGPQGKWVEVQIRTERMDAIAEWGFAAHCKGVQITESEEDKWVEKIREMLQNPESDALEFLDEFKMNLYSSEIVVFTPKGKMVTMPKGATIIDFAYEIHTDVGNHCIGAKVNGSLVQVSHVLQGGDSVKILTDKNQTPQKEWLKIAISKKSQIKIKKAIKKSLDVQKIRQIDRAISEFNFSEAKELLMNLYLGTDNNVLEEYNFLFSQNNSKEQDLDKISNNFQYYRFLINIWCLTGLNELPNENLFSSYEETKDKFQIESSESQAKRSQEVSKKRNDNLNNEKIGDKLENDVIKLFEHFFFIENDDKTIILTKLRKQKKGTQYGFDIEFNCKLKDKREIIGLIECKNIRSQSVIGVKDVGDKLINQILHRDKRFDFWILISPYIDPSSELNETIRQLSNKFDINLQIWSPESYVNEFFGIVPELFDDLELNIPPDGVHPRQWTEEERHNIIDKWKTRLIIEPNIPRQWRDYEKDPSNFLLNNEKDFAKDFERLYFNHIGRFCYDDKNVVLTNELNGVIENWLKKPVKDSPTLFLLGDFGDGKSTYTYILCRSLAQKLFDNPKTSWVPIRFSLKNFGNDEENNNYNFVKDSLEQIGFTLQEWYELVSIHKDRILLILDGFDEISKNLDYSTIEKNFDKLVEYYEEYFSNLKVLITSRKHFLSHAKQKERLLGRLGKPKLIHLLPFEKSEVIDHITKNVEDEEDLQKIEKLKSFYDPVGLATKPLFLEMLKGSIRDLPEQDITELILYRTYVKKSLQRKIHQIDKKNINIGYDRMERNLEKVLKKIALELHRQKKEYIYLSDISDGRIELKYAERLWEISKVDDTSEEDATARVAVRSLLSRIEVRSENLEKKWPVDFFHRSLKEYFVALGLFDLLNDNLSEFESYLKEVILNQEIIHFLCDIMKESKVEYQKKLVYLIKETEITEDNQMLQNLPIWAAMLSIYCINIKMSCRELIGRI